MISKEWELGKSRRDEMGRPHTTLWYRFHLPPLTPISSLSLYLPFRFAKPKLNDIDRNTLKRVIKQQEDQASQDLPEIDSVDSWPSLG